MRRILLLLALLAVMCASAVAAPQPRFELPYDLVVARDGTIWFTDRSRVLTLRPSTGRVRVYRKVPGASELAGLARLEDGTLYAADLPSGRILRIPRGGPVVTVGMVPEPVDLVVDPAGSTLWVASIAEGVGLVQVDVASGTVEPFAAVRQPHGVARTAAGDFVVHDGHVVSRVDGDDGSRDAARESRRVQGRRRPKRRRVRSDGRAERGSGRPHLAERSRRTRGRDGPARPTPRRPGARSADAPERRRSRPGRVPARRADRAGAGDPARQPRDRRIDDRRSTSTARTRAPRRRTSVARGSQAGSRREERRLASPPRRRPSRRTRRSGTARSSGRRA